METVSIIIPIYNSEKTIEKCIQSILNQTYSDIELILINDGSKDNSLEIIKQYESENIKIIDKKNEGVSKTRNLGIKEASGKYIMFVDNDDFLDRECIEDFVKNIEENDIIIGGYKRVTTKKVLFKYILEDYKWSKYIIMAPWAKLYKRDFLIKNNIEFLDYKIGEDVYFNMLAYSKTKKIKILSNCYYNWFYNDLSVSNTIQKGLNNKLDITILLNKIINLNNFYEEPLNIYYINRYLIWYLLFSGKNSSPDRFKLEYYRLNKWKKENNVFYNLNPLSNKIKGETFKNRMIVLIFMIIEKLNLIKLFSNIYCKGSDN